MKQKKKSLGNSENTLHYFFQLEIMRENPSRYNHSRICLSSGSSLWTRGIYGIHCYILMTECFLMNHITNLCEKSPSVSQLGLCRGNFQVCSINCKPETDFTVVALPF